MMMMMMMKKRRRRKDAQKCRKRHEDITKDRNYCFAVVQKVLVDVCDIDCRVRIHGLVGAAHLNGKEGVMRFYMGASPRASQPHNFSMSGASSEDVSALTCFQSALAKSMLFTLKLSRAEPERETKFL